MPYASESAKSPFMVETRQPVGDAPVWWTAVAEY
jgi:hypothetical protein